jgi:hypothetical protein
MIVKRGLGRVLVDKWSVETSAWGFNSPPVHHVLDRQGKKGYHKIISTLCLYVSITRISINPRSCGGFGL